jgi:hypothetical protein
MAGITLADAQAQLAAWLAASAAIAAKQSYEIETAGTRRKLTLVDAAEVRNNIQFWQNQVQALTPAASGGRRRIRYVVNE